MTKTLKVIFTLCSMIGCVGAIGGAGFEFADKVGDLKKLTEKKVDVEVPEVKEA